MMTISNDTGYRPLDRSLGPFVAEIDRFDPFFEGAGMLLKAMIDEVDTPVSTAATSRSTALSVSKTIATEPDASRRRLYLEAAAARFGDPLMSTVICIRPSGRSAFAL